MSKMDKFIIPGCIVALILSLCFVIPQTINRLHNIKNGLNNITIELDNRHNEQMQAAYDLGRESKEIGVPANANPYIGGNYQKCAVQWLKGWKDGVEDIRVKE